MLYKPVIEKLKKMKEDKLKKNKMNSISLKSPTVNKIKS